MRWEDECEWWQMRIQKKVATVNFKILSSFLLGQTEEKHEKLQPGFTVNHYIKFQFSNVIFRVTSISNNRQIFFLPQIQNVSSPLLPSKLRDLDGSGTGPNTYEGDGLLDRAIQMLQQLNDRLTAVSTLDEQQLRRLETLEYR
jgi:hypothetical protein